MNFYLSLILISAIGFNLYTGCGTANCVSLDELSKEYSETLLKINKFEALKEKRKYLVDTANNIRVVNTNVYGAETILYYGDSKNSFADGLGKVYWLKGVDTVELYEGNFMDGYYHGKGKQELNSRILLGTWDRGNHVGEIAIKFRDGRKYKGNHLDSVKSFGKFEYPNGDYYIGYSKEYSRDSIGTYYFKNGDKYVGSYIFDQRNDHGKYFFSNKDSIEVYYDHGTLTQGSEEELQKEMPSFYIERINLDFEKFRNSIKYPCVLSKYSNLAPIYRVNAKVVFYCDGNIEFKGFKENNVPDFVEKSVVNALHKLKFSPAKIDGAEVTVYHFVPFVYEININ